MFDRGWKKGEKGIMSVNQGMMVLINTDCGVENGWKLCGDDFAVDLSQGDDSSLKKIADARPHVLLLDSACMDSVGIDFLKKVRKILPETELKVVSDSLNIFSIDGALKQTESYGAEELKTPPGKYEKTKIQNPLLTLAEDRRFVESLIRNMTEGLIFIDKMGKITFMNKVGEEILRCSACGARAGNGAECSTCESRRLHCSKVFTCAGENLCCPLGEKLLEQPSRAAEKACKKNSMCCPLCRTLAYEEPVKRFKVRLKGEEDRKVSIEMTTMILKTRSGVTNGAVGIFYDVTSQEKMEEAVRRMDRLASIGQFSAGIAHEVRNPLTSISTTTGILKRKLKGDDESLRHIKTISSEIERLNKIVKDVLKFARPSKPVLAPCCLEDILDESLDLLDGQCRKQGVSVHRRRNERLPHVLADFDQIQQVLVNLLLNAIESMENGGFIVIKTETSSRIVQSRLTGDHPVEGAAVEISDTGKGISHEDLEKIFAPFFSKKKSGSGLGLSISQRIIDEHNGILEVESTPGKGTLFRVILPASD
ncbi:MAG: ATP-binding protein [bacterium]